MINLLISGVCGRLGQTVLECANKTENITVAAGVDLCQSKTDLGFPVYESILDVKEKIDVVIDFSRPSTLESLIEYSKENNVPVVFATTGYTKEQLESINECGRHVPVFFSANMSLGVNLLKELIRKTAEVLGEQYDIEIVEYHHNLKVDAPSGTALALADTLNEVFEGKKQYMYGRNPEGGRREKKEIGIHAVRGGTVVGQHDVMFLGNDEIINVSHSASSKQVFATGAIRAAEYLIGKTPGVYNMTHIFSESHTLSTISTDESQTVFSVYGSSDDAGYTEDIFDSLSKNNINIDIINQSPQKDGSISVAFSVSKKQADSTKEVISEIMSRYASVSFSENENITKITLDGIGMEHQSGVAAKVFSCLSKVNADIIIITTSETKISICVDSSDAQKAKDAIAAKFGI